jgi:type IV pilus assembly protein PilE
MNARISRGFTLVEVMVTVAIVAIIASIAMPQYSGYVQRGRVPAALDGLNSFYTRMEQRFQDTGNYAAAGACAIAAPAVDLFTITCSTADAGKQFTATATGSGKMAGYTYTINYQGVRRTTAHPKGTPAGNCWSTRGKVCDS